MAKADRPMSRVGSPLVSFVQVLPASIDLYSPSPKCALRWLLFSPVPSQRTLEFLGSMTMQQLLKAPPSSKIGVKVTPRLTVFQTPPKAAATYQVLVLFGSILM